jgi:predicted metal-binding protein
VKDNIERLIVRAKELGAGAAAILSTSDIKFAEEFRKACEQNVCGKYGTNWMCPPEVGSFEELKTQAMEFSHGLVFQTVYQLEDSFDYEGMLAGATAHDKVFQDIRQSMRGDDDLEKILGLNAGECRFCKECNCVDKEPCRFPDEAVASIESYGIDVTALVSSCGMCYNNGPNTVSYVGLMLF